jgi:hypothetical protein
MDRHLGRTIALTIVGILMAVSLAGGGWWLAQRGDNAPAASGPPAATAPATVAPTTPPATTPTTPPDAKAAVTTALAFMRREVGMASPVAGPFRWTGTRSGQVDIRARIPGDVNPSREPVSTVSLQRLSTVWYVLGVRSAAIGLVVPQPQDAIRSPLGIIAVANDRVRVRITQDRYGADVELGAAHVSPEPAPKLAGTIAFAHPSAATGSVVLTTATGRNGEVWAATVVRLRFATGQPPQILGIRISPQLPQQDGVPQLPAKAGTLTIRVTASHADQARLVYTPAGTETAWYAKVVSQDTTASNGLRLTWHHSRFDALGNVMVVVVGPGGVTTHDLFSAT